MLHEVSDVLPADLYELFFALLSLAGLCVVIITDAMQTTNYLSFLLSMDFPFHRLLRQFLTYLLQHFLLCTSQKEEMEQKNND